MLNQKKPNVIDGLIICACGMVFVALIATLHRRSPAAPEDEAKHQAAVADINRFKSAVQAYVRDHKKLPLGLRDLTPRYIPQVPLDPYGHRYVFTFSPDVAIIRYSGKDGRSKGYGPYDIDVIAIVQRDGSAE